MCYNDSILKSYGGEKKLIKTQILKGLIVQKGLTQAKMAKIIGITPKTFYDKMKSGVFGSDEIEIMIDRLEIENPTEIFFGK